MHGRRFDRHWLNLNALPFGFLCGVERQQVSVASRINARIEFVRTGNCRFRRGVASLAAFPVSPDLIA